MPQLQGARATRWLLPLVLVLYLALGALYAVYTPRWQAPDEPAHYNYVQFLADHYRFPVLKMGDFPAAYLEEIKAAGFPPEMSIAPIRYEFHQPPLYYLLAVPIYRLFDGSLLALRLFSVILGAVLLVVVYWTVEAFAPGQPLLALATTAFVAFLPMHLAMTAAVNNDSLAELLLATLLLLAIRYLRGATGSRVEGAERRLLPLMGIVTALGLVTKSSLYVALPLLLLAIAGCHLWPGKISLSLVAVARDASLYLLPALGLALPWWLRNIALYGRGDFLGLGRHDQVVAGQLRTAEFVAERGWAALAHDFLSTSFHSFWGQFGWMGVLLDQRLYQALAILSALALAGFSLWAAGAWHRRRHFAPWQWAAACLLVLLGLFTLASYLWYNTQFLQHQGRYLFRGLVPIGLALALGWREVLRRERSLWLAAFLLCAAGVLRGAGLLPNWPLLMLLASAAALAGRRFLAPAWDPLIHSYPYLLLIVLDLVALFLFIVPALTVLAA
jgi:4-amino-4-deoxy-L-arabinose transferase-like glycosyltransferase